VGKVLLGSDLSGSILFTAGDFNMWVGHLSSLVEGFLFFFYFLYFVPVIGLNNSKVWNLFLLNFTSLIMIIDVVIKKVLM
jgi:hypothetical protein